MRTDAALADVPAELRGQGVPARDGANVGS